MTAKTTKILDATSGDSSVFTFQDGALNFKFTISGTPGANIKVFTVQPDSYSNFANGLYVKICCADWANSQLSLLCKTSHVDDTTYNETGDVYNSDNSKIFKYS